MRILIKTLLVALVITIPISAICAGANVVTRLPDVYQYEFKSTNALKSFDLDKTSDEVGEFISDFMVGKESEFQLWSGEEERPQAVFKENEIAAAETARHFINVLGLIGGLCIAITVIAIVLLKKYELDQELRKKLKWAAAVYAAFMAIYLLGFYIAAGRGISLGDMLHFVPGEEDILPQIMTEGLAKKLYFATATVSTVILALFEYLLFKLTAPKRIFSRNY